MQGSSFASVTGSIRRLVPVLAILTLTAAASTVAGAAEHRFERVEVRNGHPVREAPYGVIFALGSGGCPRSRTATAGAPILGTRGTDLSLDLGLRRCDGGGSPPEILCDWEIVPAALEEPTCGSPGGRSSGRWSWTGKSSTQSLALPDRTGIYELRASCQTDTGELGFESPVFVTWKAPVLRPELGDDPLAEWYSRAACWGGGFGTEDRADDVLSAMTRRVFLFGNETWRYGSAERGRFGNRFRFPLGDGTSELFRIRDARFLPSCADRSSYCRCSWSSLITEDSGCTFGICHNFAEALEKMAWLQGLEVERCNIRPPTPFLTGEPKTTSLDPSLDPIVACEGCYPPEYHPYYFGNHWVVRRCAQGTGCKLFDPTFGQFPTSVEQVVRQVSDDQQLCSAPGAPCKILFEGTTIELTPTGIGYGLWSFFSQGTVGGEKLVPLIREVEVTAEFGPADEDRDGYFESLVVTCKLPTRAAKTRTLGALVKDGRVVAVTPTWDSEQHTSGYPTGLLGRKQRFIFSGEAIRRSGVDGPYELRALLVDPSNLVRTLYSATSEKAWKASRFREIEAEYVSCTD